MAKTDFASRYYGSALGLAWALLNPLIRLIVYYFTFSILVFRKREVEFVLYLFTGLIIWMFFSQVTKSGIRVLEQKKYLIQNIQIDKLDIYLSHTISGFIGLLFNCVAYLLIGSIIGFQVSWHSLMFFPILMALFILSMAVTMILSVTYIYFKDLDHLWDIAILFGFWTIPIIWPQELVMQEYPLLLYMNPLTGMLINTRHCLIYGTPVDYGILLYDVLFCLSIFAIALYVVKEFGHRAGEVK